jgi:cation-transporting P-type ATPase C
MQRRCVSGIHSRHPLAEAVIRSTEERHISIPPHEECEVLVGLGMRTRADGRTLLLGSPSLLRSEKVRVSRKAFEWVNRLQRQAETPLLLAVDGKLVGLISLRDEVRPEATAVLAALRAAGIRRIGCSPAITPTPLTRWQLSWASTNGAPRYCPRTNSTWCVPCTPPGT